MKKGVFLCFFGLLITVSFPAQKHVADSLRKLIDPGRSDTSQVKLLNKLAWTLRTLDPDSALFFAWRGAEMAVKTDFQRGRGDCYNTIGVVHYRRGEFAEAVDAHLQALTIRENIGDVLGQSYSHINLGNVYSDQHNNSMALASYKKAAELILTLPDHSRLAFVYLNICAVLLEQRSFDEGLQYAFRARDAAIEGEDETVQAEAWNNMGVVYEARKDLVSALQAYQHAWQLSEHSGDQTSMTDNAINIGNIYRQQNELKLAVAWHEKAEEIARSIGYLEGIRVLYDDMTSDYECLSDYKTALFYHRKFKALNDSLFNDDNTSRISDLVLKWEQEKSRRELTASQQALSVANTASTFRKKETLFWSLFAASAFVFLSIFIVQRRRIRRLKVILRDRRFSGQE